MVPRRYDVATDVREHFAALRTSRAFMARLQCAKAHLAQRTGPLAPGSIYVLANGGRFGNVADKAAYPSPSRRSRNPSARVQPCGVVEDAFDREATDSWQSPLPSVGHIVAEARLCELCS